MLVLSTLITLGRFLQTSVPGVAKSLPLCCVSRSAMTRVNCASRSAAAQRGPMGPHTVHDEPIVTSCSYLPFPKLQNQVHGHVPGFAKLQIQEHAFFSLPPPFPPSPSLSISISISSNLITVSRISNQSGGRCHMDGHSRQTLRHHRQVGVGSQPRTRRFLFPHSL